MDMNNTNHRLTRARGLITRILGSVARSAPVDGTATRLIGWDPYVARRWAT